jgi:hypothetical protein
MDEVEMTMYKHVQLLAHISSHGMLYCLHYCKYICMYIHVIWIRKKNVFVKKYSGFFLQKTAVGLKLMWLIFALGGVNHFKGYLLA